MTGSLEIRKCNTIQYNIIHIVIHVDRQTEIDTYIVLYTPPNRQNVGLRKYNYNYVCTGPLTNTPVGLLVAISTDSIESLPEHKRKGQTYSYLYF